MFFYKKVIICLILLCFFCSEKILSADDRIVGIKVTVQLVFQVQIKEDDWINIIMEPQRGGLGETKASGTLIDKDVIVTNQHVLDIESLIRYVFWWEQNRRFFSNPNWKLHRVNVIVEVKGRSDEVGLRRGETSGIISSSELNDEQIEIYFADHGIEMIWESANHDLAFVFLSSGNEFSDYYVLAEPERYYVGFPVVASAIDYKNKGQPFTGSGDFLGVLEADSEASAGDGFSYFLFGLPIQAGCSGGAVLSKDSQRVVAILAGYGLNEYEGTSFGVPVSIIEEEYKNALEERMRRTTETR